MLFYNPDHGWWAVWHGIRSKYYPTGREALAELSCLIEWRQCN